LFASGQQREQEIPLAGNARSLQSLKIRIGDALKWLADQFNQSGNVAYKPYAELKPKLRFGIGERGLIIRLPQCPSVVPPERYKFLNLDADTLKRLSAMSQDPQYTPEHRQIFAETVRHEMATRQPTSSLAPGGLCLKTH
jgi:hypothetical protein